MMISWTKKADFDVLVELESNGDLFVACRGLSTQDGFERCHFGQGHTKYFLTIDRFSGARKAKGAIWISFTDESRVFTRTEGADTPGLRYLGNIHQPGDDPDLQRLARSAAERPPIKRAAQQ